MADSIISLSELKNDARQAVTVKEFASLVGAPPLSIYTNIETIKHFKIGKRIYIPKTTVLEMLGGDND